MITKRFINRDTDTPLLKHLYPDKERAILNYSNGLIYTQGSSVIGVCLWKAYPDKHFRPGKWCTIIIYLMEPHSIQNMMLRDLERYFLSIDVTTVMIKSQSEEMRKRLLRHEFVESPSLMMKWYPQ